MAKGKLVRVCILYIVAAAAVGGSFTQALFIVLQLRVNTSSSLYIRSKKNAQISSFQVKKRVFTPLQD